MSSIKANRGQNALVGRYWVDNSRQIALVSRFFMYFFTIVRAACSSLPTPPTKVTIKPSPFPFPCVLSGQKKAACDPDRPSKPCRHYLGGECLRKDCAFSHDMATRTCRFWLQGQCLNGVACLFLHDLDVPALPHVSDDRVDEVRDTGRNLCDIADKGNGCIACSFWPVGFGRGTSRRSVFP